MYSLNMFHELLVPGVFAVVNETEKKIYISRSKSLLEGISMLVRDIKSGTRCKDISCPIGDLNIVILDIVKDEDIYERQFYWEQHYLSLGYSLYNNRIATQAKIVIVPITDGNGVYIGVVYRMNHRDTVLGLFPSYMTARQWKRYHYPESDKKEQLKKIYCENDETVMFRRKSDALNAFKIK